jgi:hypothetical protein
MCQTRPLQRHRPQGCDLPPNKAWCRNSGRNEIECDSRCRRRARKPFAHHRAVSALSDNCHRSGKQCQSDAGTPCSGTGRPDRVHPWQLLEASRSGIVRSVPRPPPNLVWQHFGRSCGLPSSRFDQQGCSKYTVLLANGLQSRQTNSRRGSHSRYPPKRVRIGRSRRKQCSNRSSLTPGLPQW